MIAFYQQQLHCHLAVEGQLRRCGLDRHSLLDWRGASSQETIAAGKLDNTHSAGSNRAQTLQMAKRRNLLSSSAGCFKNSLTFLRGYQFAIDPD
jgi:hypothetical protein